MLLKCVNKPGFNVENQKMNKSFKKKIVKWPVPFFSPHFELVSSAFALLFTEISVVRGTEISVNHTRGHSTTTWTKF